MEKMRVLLLSPLPPPAGGIATWTKLYINSILAKKNKVDLINTAIIGKRIEFLNKKIYFAEILRLYNIFKQFIKLIKCTSYNVIHINTSCSQMGMVRDLLLV